MESRLYRISPSLFGKYPKQFDKLFKNISSYQKEDEEEIKVFFGMLINLVIIIIMGKKENLENLTLVIA